MNARRPGPSSACGTADHAVAGRVNRRTEEEAAQ